MRKLGLVSFILLTLMAPPAALFAAIDVVPPQIGDGWRTGSPRSVGLDSARLDATAAAIRRQEYPKIHAVLIERNDKLVYESYFAGPDARWGHALGSVVFDRDTKHDVRSISKSVISALVGITFGAEADRRLGEPLLHYFPEHNTAASAAQKAITVRDALTMTSGLKWDEDTPYEDPANDEARMDSSADPLSYVLGHPVVTKPGTHFQYNGGTVELLAAMIERRTQRPLREFAQEVLFRPLDITDWEWVGYSNGTPAAASGLRLRPRDLAKFGSLYLHQGRWNGRQIVPAHWVSESLKQSVVPHLNISGLATGYGYLWWLDRVKLGSRTIQIQEAVGNGGQRIFLLPQLHMAVTILAGRYGDVDQAVAAKRLLVEGILPAIEFKGGD